MTNNNPIIADFKARIGQTMADSPSPVGRFLNGTLKDVDEGMLLVEYKIREEWTNPMKRLHGGTIAMIMDDMIGATVFMLNNEFHYVSVNLNVDFLFSAKVDQLITAKSTIIRKGKSVINAQCEIFNHYNKIIARATSSLVVTGVRNTH